MLMKAIVQKRYGPPDMLRLAQIDKPFAADDEVLVRVRAAAVNRTDCANLRAKPFFMRLVIGLLRPKRQVPGTAFAGVVEAVGKNVVSLAAGDRVFGFDDEGAGALAEYLAIAQDRVAVMPDKLDYARAAAGSEGFHYAYNFIDKLRLEPGQSVLVNGATGAIGSAAVQLLNHFDADVTAVCATQHVALVEALGAARVIDYSREDFTRDGQRYDYVFDTVGKSSFRKCLRLLKPGGIYISSDLGFLAQNLFLPAITPLVKQLFGNRKTIFPVPRNIKRSLLLLRSLVEQGEFEAVIDREYPLQQVADAFRYVETGQKTGNVVIAVAAASSSADASG
jgi:NADPH:quinone reductase-like Zn-dependent oxidoreductase